MQYIALLQCTGVTLFIQLPYRLYYMYAWSNSTLQRLRLEEELQNRQSVREIVQQLELVEAARMYNTI